MDDYFSFTECAVFKIKHNKILTFHFLFVDMRLAEVNRTKLVLDMTQLVLDMTKLVLDMTKPVLDMTIDMLNKVLVELEVRKRPINSVGT